MKKIVLIVITVVLIGISCQRRPVNKTIRQEEKFSFVFMTDIHLMPERNATKGLLQAIDTINRINPDFVITGGDNISDALAQTYERSDSLYNLYKEIIKKLSVPVYNTMGNHEIFGLYEESGIDPSHEEYGKKMYEKRLADRYYSFDYKNWHFVVLDGIGFTEDRLYYGRVDSVQLEWLNEDLNNTSPEKPVAVVIHIPLITVSWQFIKGPTEALPSRAIVNNAQEVIDILENYNVKLVLQGHQHFLEDIYYNGIHYITGGAVCAAWWRGKYQGMEEGFLKVDISGDKFDWKYIDYGWEAN